MQFLSIFIVIASHVSRMERSAIRASWCLYADVGLELATNVTLDEDASVEHLED